MNDGDLRARADTSAVNKHDAYSTYVGVWGLKMIRLCREFMVSTMLSLRSLYCKDCTGILVLIAVIRFPHV